MRIAYVTNSTEGGGAALPIPAVTRVLRDLGAEVRVFALKSVMAMHYLPWSRPAWIRWFVQVEERTIMSARCGGWMHRPARGVPLMSGLHCPARPSWASCWRVAAGFLLSAT